MALFPLSQSSLFNDASLVSYWPLVANSTDNKDSNTGTDTDITYTDNSGPFNGINSASFNGTTSKIALPSGGNGLNLNIAGNFTILAWVKTNSGTNDTIIQNWDIETGDHEYGWLFWILSTGVIRMDLGKGGGSTGAYVCASTGTVNNNAWHLVGVTWDGTNLKTWIDGANDGSTAAANATYFTTRRTKMGAHDDTGSDTDFFAGSMADIAVFSRDLSSAEITARYNGTDSIGQRGIRGYFEV